MITLTYEEKIDLMGSLNWDYLDKPEDMLAVIEGRLESSGAFTREKLFVRSLERITWYYILGLWGLDAVKELYTPKLAGRIWPKSMRGRYDFAFAVLRREAVSSARWGDEHYKQMWRPVLSNRWYGAKQGLL
ncbi:MAG: hypothetical protein FWH38_07440 [Treponema sp.]|nr:hypothetical protein [Treponema sp.]